MATRKYRNRPSNVRKYNSHTSSHFKNLPPSDNMGGTTTINSLSTFGPAPAMLSLRASYFTFLSTNAATKTREKIVTAYANHRFLSEKTFIELLRQFKEKEKLFIKLIINQCRRFNCDVTHEIEMISDSCFSYPLNSEVGNCLINLMLISVKESCCNVLNLP